MTLVNLERKEEERQIFVLLYFFFKAIEEQLTLHQAPTDEEF